MRRTRALIGAVTLAAGVGVSVATAASAPAQTGVTDTVQQVTPPRPAAPTVSTPSTAPVTTPTAPSTPSVPQAPSAQDAPKAPAAGSPAPSGQTQTQPGGVKPPAQPDTKDLPKPGVDAPAAPKRPSTTGDSPGAGSNGAGSRRDPASADASPGSSSAPSSGRSSGDGSGSGSPAGASAAGGSGATGEQGGGARTTGTGRRQSSTPGAFVDTASPSTEASWLEYALDPRYERRFTRKLTETVAELEACLPELGARDRRVLTLRSGLGGDGGRSRAAVARRLDLTGIGVAVTEQGALRELLSVARSGACGQGAATAAAGLASAGTVAAGMGGGWVIDRLRLGSPPPAASDAGSAASAVGRVGPALLDADPFSRVSVAGPTSAPAGGGEVLGIGSWLEAILIALLTGLLALLAWLAIARARRSFREPRARRA